MTLTLETLLQNAGPLGPDTTLTGLHLLRTGEVEANLPRLAEEHRKPFLLELIARKREEKGAAPELDWAFHDGQLRELEASLDQAFLESPLPEERDRQANYRFLVDCRLRGSS